MGITELTIELIILLSLIGFSAGFLDSIVGGGGLIGTPAMLNLFPHWSILNIVGTNRTSSIVGTSVAARNYFRFAKPEWHLLLPGCAGAFVASFSGAKLATQIDGNKLKGAVVIAIIALAIYMLVRKDLGKVENRRFTSRREIWAAFFVGSACGFYNGLVGPGTGTFLVFGFVSVLGLDFLKSSAVSKAVNVAGDVSSFAVLAWSGYVVWLVAIPLVISNVAGSYFGSKLAILKGSRFIRQVFFVVVFALIARFCWQLWTS